jgi:hypothetical protein
MAFKINYQRNKIMFKLKSHAAMFALVIGLLTAFSQTAQGQTPTPSCTFIGQQATLTRQDAGVATAGPTTVQAGSIEFNGIPGDGRFSVDVEGTTVRMFNNTSNANVTFNSPNTITISVSGSQTITGINSVTINGVTNFTPQNVSFTSNSVTFNVANSGWNAGTSVLVGLQLSCPTAASVTVSGRVLIYKGRGLMNATVVLNDMNGSTRNARTGAFGYFRFDDVEAGQTYIFNVSSKRYTFAPQVVTVMEDLTELNFTAQNELRILPKK